MSDKSSNDAEKKSATLTDEDIVTEREVGRRSVIGAIGASVLGAAAIATGGCIIHSQARTGITDSDTGYGSDPAGNGRGARRVYVVNSTGITDHDGGAMADPAGNGRGAPQGMATGITDGDGGTYTDPAGAGRGPHH